LIVGIIHFSFFAIAQSFNPIEVSGFNHDVIAESLTASPLATTTTEMDAFDPSNFVLFTKAYAKARSIPASYGLPDDGRIVNGNKIYQLAGSRGNNALYLPKGTEGTLTFTPGNYDAISILGLATEGQASLQIFVTYENGANRIVADSYRDWFDGLSPVVKGIGRVKREDGNAPYYEGGENPRMYSIHVTLESDKRIQSITFQNVSPGPNKASNRAVIFAVSGFRKEEAVPVLPKKKLVVKKTEPGPTIAPKPVEVGTVVVLKKVLFKQSSAELLDDSYPELDSVANFLNENPSIRIEVAGHTDAYGSAKANLKLSNERAAEIKKYLGNKGVSSDRITSKGYGGSKPIAPNTTEESRRLNRRVEFVILSK
jgi:outer membrane protein OmpA-like peptidoglycan-associated protein